jgi:hypothetical protein
MLTYTALPTFLRCIVCRLGVHFLGAGTNVLPTAIHRFCGASLCECACLHCGKWIWVVDDNRWVGPVCDRT